MMQTPDTAARQIVQDLKGTWHRQHGMVRCPAHKDGRASLSVTPGRTAVLFHCFAGCTQNSIMAALRDMRLNPAIDTASTDAVPIAHNLMPLINDIWSLAQPTIDTPAQLYLESRDIGRSCIGRFAPAVMTYEAGRKIRLPALLLPMTEGHELRALLRIFIDRDGHKARCLDDPKRTLGNTRGSVIQIGAPPDEIMNLAEGFEDAESAIVLRGLAGCAAVCGVERYHQITIPDHVRHVVIYSQHGHAATAGLERGKDNLTANGRSLEIVLPPPRCDWNDALRAKPAKQP